MAATFSWLVTCVGPQVFLQLGAVMVALVSLNFVGTLKPELVMESGVIAQSLK